MYRIFTAVLALLIAVTLGACASRPNYTQVDSKLPEVSYNQARIYFYRLNSTVGLEYEPDIFLNGNLVGQSITGEFFYVDVKPGSYEVRCGVHGPAASFSAGSEGNIYVRTGYSIMDHEVKPKVVRESWAQDEMSDLKLAGSVPQGGILKDKLFK